jgi:hypothetical protein
MAKRKKDKQHNGQKKEGQTTQWPKEKGQKDNNDLPTITHKAKDQTTRNCLSFCPFDIGHCIACPSSLSVF